MSLHLLQTEIESHLEKIEKTIGPDYKLTLIASHNGARDLKDADILMTMSDRKTIMRAVDRFLPEPANTGAAALLAIGDHLRTQDNRCTSNPMFCIQVCERIGPIDPTYGTGHRMYHNHQESETYYPDRPDPEEWARLNALDDKGNLPESVTAGDYFEKWTTVQTCFTEDGCKQHLELNGHNYRHYYGTRIYVESFHRNPEMLAIREFLMANTETPPSQSNPANTEQADREKLPPDANEGFHTACKLARVELGK